METSTPSKNSRAIWLASICLLVGVLGFGAVPASAASGIFTRIFEMEGNAIDENDASLYKEGEDWQRTNNDIWVDLWNTYLPSATKPTGWDFDVPYSGKAAVRVFVPDYPGLPGFVGTIFDDNIFGAGCKDDLDLNTCKSETGNSPDKNQWTNGYAAFYNIEGLAAPVPVDGLPPGTLYHQNGDLVIVMGGDVHDGDGSSQVGGWLFRQQVPAELIVPGEDFPFSRSIGDILVTVDWSEGGRTATVRAYRWIGGDTTECPTPGVVLGTDDNLCKIFEGPNAVCTPEYNGLACAIANYAPTEEAPEGVGETPAPWPYIAKGDRSVDPANGIFTENFPETTLLEGILNLSAILRLNDETVGCFSDFMWETRSSGAPGETYNAKLKDYLLGDTELCGIDVDKSGGTLSKVGDLVSYNILVENTGIVRLYKQSITDTLLGDLTSTNGNCPGGDEDNLTEGESCVESNACGAYLEPDGTCAITAWRRVATGDPDPLPNTVTVVYDSDPGLQGDEVTSSNDHSVNLFQPAVEVVKGGDTLSKAGDDVTYSFTINNLSSDDAPNLLIDDTSGVTDTVLGNLTATAKANGCTSLAYGGSCSFNVVYTVQSGDPDPLDNTVSVLYHPDGFPNNITDEDSHSVNLFQPSVDVTKTGDTLSKVGDPVNYTITVTNDGSSDNPGLENGTITDTLLGNLLDGSNPYVTSSDCTGTLGPSGSCTIQATRTVQAGDPDPLPNTVTVHFDPTGSFDNDITDSDGHSVNLFQPGVDVTKTGDTLSKVGDPASYTITVNNTGSGDSPNLVNGTISDTLLGNLLDGSNPYVTSSTCSAALATGASCTIQATRTVQAGDPDPLPNTVTVHYNPDGFPNDISDSDGHSVNLFQPGVDVTKTGDTLSKVGDPASYTITVNNTGSGDSPNLVNGTISDTLLGNLLDGSNPYVTSSTCSATLATGASCTIQATRTVQAGDPDPLPNTVTVHYNPDGFPNDISDSDGHSVNLFQPGVDVTKTGDTLSKVGDPASYTITVNNTGSGDSPNLVNGTISDTLLGNLLDGSNPYVTSSTCSAALATGASCTIQATRTVQAGDPDPLPNTVTVHYNPDGFPNDISDSDGHSVNLFQPGVDVTKTGDTLSKVGDPASYTITVNNTGSGDSPNLVNGTISDTLLGNLLDGSNPYVTSSTCSAALATGASCTIQATRTVQAGDPDPLPNTVTVHYNPDGFPNDISDSDGHSVNLFQPGVDVAKVCYDPSGPTEPPYDTVVVHGDPLEYRFTITNDGSSDSPSLVLASVLDQVTVGSDPPLPADNLTAAATAAGCASLAYGESCSFTVQFDTSGVMAMDDVTVSDRVDVLYNPDGFPNNITDYATASCTVTPGLEGCTPGFWQGGYGRNLWNEPTDPDWPDRTGEGGTATNPFTHDTLFCDYFGCKVGTKLAGLTMIEIVGTGGGEMPERKAARNVIAAYLNTAWSMRYDFGLYDEPGEIAALWTSAVSGGISYMDVHLLLGGYNNQECPIP